MDVKIDEKTKTLTIVLPIEEGLSTSGKSYIVASTRGNKPTTALYEGCVVTIGVNAYVSKKDAKGRIENEF